MPDFFILGSKRKPNMHWEDRFKDMVKHRCLEVGYGAGGSFEHLYGKPEAEIVSALKEMGEVPGSYNAHKLFLNLRPGDWVAVKKNYSPRGSALVINAYARVVQRGGLVYYYYRGKAPLHHCIHADYVESGIEHTFHLGYARTIHRLTKPKHIRQIFAPVFGKKPPKLEVAIPAQRALWHRRAALLTTVEKQTRRTKAGEIRVGQLHHRIRNKLCRHLIRQHGKENVRMEQDFVDIQVSKEKTLVFYEIKPYRNVLQCVREALGQVLLYAWHKTTIQHQELKLIVVGPSVPTNDERGFINFVKRELKIEFDYLHFK
jgi:hypothetical protein